jgi:hypothetical protein
MTDHPDDELSPATDETVASERQKEFTRRALLRAGWTVPLVTTVNVRAAAAQSPAPHNDAHGDHVDTPHSDHADTPHQDHQDHLDAHADAHNDGTPPHSDVPHVDSGLVGLSPSNQPATTAHVDVHGDSHGSA